MGSNPTKPAPGYTECLGKHIHGENMSLDVGSSKCEHKVNIPVVSSRYFQHANFIPIVGVGKRGEYLLVHGDLPRQHPFGTTLRFIGPVPADSRQ